MVLAPRSDNILSLRYLYYDRPVMVRTIHAARTGRMNRKKTKTLNEFQKTFTYRAMVKPNREIHDL